MIERLIHAIFHRDESGDLPVVSQIKSKEDYQVFLKLLPSLYNCPYCARRVAISALSYSLETERWKRMYAKLLGRGLTGRPNSP